MEYLKKRNCNSVLSFKRNLKKIFNLSKRTFVPFLCACIDIFNQLIVCAHQPISVCHLIPQMLRAGPLLYTMCLVYLYLALRPDLQVTSSRSHQRGHKGQHVHSSCPLLQPRLILQNRHIICGSEDSRRVLRHAANINRINVPNGNSWSKEKCPFN